MSKRTGTTRQSSTTDNNNPRANGYPTPEHEQDRANEQAGLSTSDAQAATDAAKQAEQGEPEPDGDNTVNVAYVAASTAWSNAISASIEAAPTYALPAAPADALRVALTALKRSDRDAFVAERRAVDLANATGSTPPNVDLLAASGIVGAFADTVRQAPKQAGSTRTPRVVDTVGDALAMLVTMSTARQQVLSTLTDEQAAHALLAEQQVLAGDLPVGAGFGPSWPTWARRGSKQTGSGSTGTRTTRDADASRLPADLSDLAGVDLSHRNRDGSILTATVNNDGTRVTVGSDDYASLSAAARGASGQASVNGRLFWQRADAGSTSVAA